MTDLLGHLLDGGYPLAPMCHHYLDRDKLGSDEDRAQLVEALADVYRLHPGPNHTTTPRTYARRYIEPLDAVSINVIHAAWRRGDITDRELNVMKIQQYPAEEARNYAMLVASIKDLPRENGITRQFDGLRVSAAALVLSSGRFVDLSTDELFAGNVALFRYAVAVCSERPNNPFFLKTDEAIVVHPSIREVIWENPSKADIIARLVVSRNEQSADMIRELLSDGVPDSLSEGFL